MLSKLGAPSLRRSVLSALATRSTSRALSVAAKGDVFTATDPFMHRHMGSQGEDKQKMLTKLGFDSLESLVASTVPEQIRLPKKLNLDPPLSESEALAKLKKIMSKNKVLKSFIGTGYYETITPNVILRNVLENPGWYTAYTPYQAEIAQGRLQSLLNFQTMVCDLTGMALSNASLLDEVSFFNPNQSHPIRMNSVSFTLDRPSLKPRRCLAHVPTLSSTLLIPPITLTLTPLPPTL